jgi:hypothetical protein
MIVVEGVDNSGKSTLIKALQTVFPHAPVQGSEGPPKYKGEMDERVARYIMQPANTIYDRHPCVSQPIYGTMRTHLDPIKPELIKLFYDKRPLFIYCDGGTRGMEQHQVNHQVDTPEHLAAVADNYTKLLIQYRHWAAQHALINYRIGDDIQRLVGLVQYLENHSHAHV